MKNNRSKNADIKNAHILVVDDETGFTNMLQSFLEPNFKKVHVAYDGDECLDVLGQYGEEILAVTLGVKMPRMDGLEVMRRLANTHKHILGVIVVTGVDDLNTAVEFWRLGNDKILFIDYISKPCDLEHLSECIKKTIGIIQTKRQQIK